MSIGLGYKRWGLVFFLAIMNSGPQTYAAALIENVESNKTEIEMTDAQESGAITSDVFGAKGGWFHPYITVAGELNDNIRNSATGEVSDFITSISPGFWFNIPRSKEAPEALKTSSLRPGGMTLPRIGAQSDRKLQAHLLYEVDILAYSSHSEENTDSHLVDGSVQYNFPGGLTLEFIEQYSRAADPRGTGDSTELDKYATNFVNILASYDIGHRLAASGAYSKFLVNYRDDRNSYRDREDNTWTAQVDYKYSSKTSLFTRYSFTDVKYDEAGRDSKEHNTSMGVSWRITGKSVGLVSSGYSIKDFSDPAVENKEAFNFGLQVRHSFSSKTSIVLSGYHALEESSISSSEYSVVSSLSAAYTQKISARVTGILNASYARDSYEGILVYGSQVGDRQDDIFSIRPALRFSLGRRFFVETAFQYLERDSNFSEFSYKSNSGWVGIGFAI